MSLHACINFTSQAGKTRERKRKRESEREKERERERERESEKDDSISVLLLSDLLAVCPFSCRTVFQKTQTRMKGETKQSFYFLLFSPD